MFIEFKTSVASCALFQCSPFSLWLCLLIATRLLARRMVCGSRGQVFGNGVPWHWNVSQEICNQQTSLCSGLNKCLLHLVFTWFILRTDHNVSPSPRKERYFCFFSSAFWLRASVLSGMDHIGIYSWCDYVLHEVIFFLKLQVHSFLSF